jgi:F-type H+-transporting ATPase subunit gamma
VTQQPIVLELLPFGSVSDYSTIGQVSTKQTPDEKPVVIDYAFEPSPSEVLNRLLPRLVETMLYQAVLESAASEHSARMMAMRNASDAAADMINSLTFTYNQFRQAAITREIAEISGGKAALE